MTLATSSRHRHRPRHRRRRSGATIALAAPLALVMVVHGWSGVSYVGTTMTVALAAKLVIARHGRRRADRRALRAAPNLRVAAVMPIHNEDPDLAAEAARSLVGQTRPLQRIEVIDDGSTDGGAAVAAVEAVLRSQDRCANWNVTRFPINRGKRAALAAGFRAADDVDIFLCIDSDTRLDPDATEHGLRPLADPEVAAVAGLVTALNWDRNLLTRLIELRYVSAFLAERAAYSFVGAVLCCCGSLSFHRAEVVRAHLDDFENQRFLGRPATFGDDRRLTNYALRAGRVVLAERSRARTAVPERLGHYVRQQVRWNKSFVRESSWVLGTFPLGHWAFRLTLVEVIGWTIVGLLTFLAAIILPLVSHPTALATVFLVTSLASYARSAAYLEDVRLGMTRRERWATFALAPLYALLHFFVLLPIRGWALATLREPGWGTRREVEVRLDPVAA